MTMMTVGILWKNSINSIDDRQHCNSKKLSRISIAIVYGSDANAVTAQLLMFRRHSSNVSVKPNNIIDETNSSLIICRWKANDSRFIVSCRLSRALLSSVASFGVQILTTGCLFSDFVQNLVWTWVKINLHRTVLKFFSLKTHFICEAFIFACWCIAEGFIDSILLQRLLVVRPTLNSNVHQKVLHMQHKALVI